LLRRTLACARVIGGDRLIATSHNRHECTRTPLRIAPIECGRSGSVTICDSVNRFSGLAGIVKRFPDFCESLALGEELDFGHPRLRIRQTFFDAVWFCGSPTGM
jgi:hypothetical protein